MAKVKDDPYVKMTLNVPRGLVAFLDKLKYMSGQTPKEHLETILSKELESILSDSSGYLDHDYIRRMFGEGSDVYDE